MKDDISLWIMNALVTIGAIWVYFIGLTNLGLGMLIGWWLSWGWWPLAMLLLHQSR